MTFASGIRKAHPMVVAIISAQADASTSVIVILFHEANVTQTVVWTYASSVRAVLANRLASALILFNQSVAFITLAGFIRAGVVVALQIAIRCAGELGFVQGVVAFLALTGSWTNANTVVPAGFLANRFAEGLVLHRVAFLAGAHVGCSACSKVAIVHTRW